MWTCIDACALPNLYKGLAGFRVPWFACEFVTVAVLFDWDVCHLFMRNLWLIASQVGRLGEWWLKSIFPTSGSKRQKNTNPVLFLAMRNESAHA